MAKQNTLKPEISKAINAFSQNNYEEAEKYCNNLLSKENEREGGVLYSP